MVVPDHFTASTEVQQMEMQVLAHVLRVNLGIVELTVTYQTHAFSLTTPWTMAVVVLLTLLVVDITVLMVEQ
jgi:hypothetical protein